MARYPALVAINTDSNRLDGLVRLSTGDNRVECRDGTAIRVRRDAVGRLEIGRLCGEHLALNGLPLESDFTSAKPADLIFLGACRLLTLYGRDDSDIEEQAAAWTSVFSADTGVQLLAVCSKLASESRGTVDVGLLEFALDATPVETVDAIVLRQIASTIERASRGRICVGVAGQFQLAVMVVQRREKHLALERFINGPFETRTWSGRSRAIVRGLVAPLGARAMVDVLEAMGKQLPSLEFGMVRVDADV
jgi:hypothetical protein